MGNLELGPEADVSQLEPLLTPENIEHLEAAFVAHVQLSVAQWLKKALDGEVAEWSREQEPNTDPSGFYHSPMPAIVLQVGGKYPIKWVAPTKGRWAGLGNF